ncbi:MAG TPA: AIM24 family protein [Oscillatoriaceae cyanobacterium M33_DOE_052]|uniref:AIM24 family protein n=1 Tax=Planktothricoides sp. SpSt-374 TaxID=2282167 RepID=A0A7C3VIP3_9CYAN|nr:AIM24 family protein [Oscillatoriaceae cyanobacterium M33_DOE_052]
MAKFEIIEEEGLRLIKVLMNNETVRAEAGALFYFLGDIRMESQGTGGVGGFFKSLATGETVVRPSYTGTGELYLEPSFEGYHILNLQGEEWVMDTGGYWASEGSVQVDAKRNKLLTGLFGGEGLFQTTAKGQGQVVIKTPGPIEEVHLRNDRLVVDGTFAVARSATLNYTVTKATKSLLGSLTSGEGFVNTYEGTGTVLLAPNAYWEVMMLRQLWAV